MRDTPRNRRLRSDFRAIQRLKSESTIFDFEATGNPPDEYDATFRGCGLARTEQRVEIVQTHVVHIRLGTTYPCVMPELAWTTPIFHPNVSGRGSVCLGGYQTHWVPSLDLAELCEMLWDMIRYANFDVKSPYNRDAANWARSQGDFKFPLDDRPVRDKIWRQRKPVKRYDEVIMAEVVTPVVAQPIRDDEHEVLFIE